MKRVKYLGLIMVVALCGLFTSSCGEVNIYIDERDCTGTWFVTFNYDNWGNYSDGGIMDLYPSGYYNYYYSEYDYAIGRVYTSGRWWTDRDNLIYTDNYGTYSYRITSTTYDSMRLRNNLPPGDVEIWYRYY